MGWQIQIQTDSSGKWHPTDFSFTDATQGQMFMACGVYPYRAAKASRVLPVDGPATHRFSGGAAQFMAPAPISRS